MVANSNDIGFKQHQSIPSRINKSAILSKISNHSQFPVSREYDIDYEVGEILDLLNSKIHDQALSSSELSNNQELLLAAIMRNKYALFLVSDELSHNSAFMLQIIRQCKRYSSYVEFVSKVISPRLLNNEQFLVTACQENIAFFPYIANNLSNNPDIISRILIKWNITYNIPEIHPRDNAELFIQAAEKEPQLVIMASETLRENEEFMLRLIKKNRQCFNYAAPLLMSNKDFIKAVCLLPKSETLFNTNSPQLNLLDESCWLEIITINSKFYSYLPEEHKKNYQFLEQAVSIQPKLILKIHCSGADVLRSLFNVKASVFSIQEHLRQLTDEQFTRLWLIAISIDNTLINNIPDEHFIINPQFIEEYYPLVKEKVIITLTSMGLSSEIINQYLAQLDQLTYHCPSANELELYKQIYNHNRIGNLLPNVPNSQEPSIEVNYSTETIDSFSTTEHNLAKALKSNVDDTDLALFEFTVFRPQTTSCKGIIIQYYGGYGEHYFNGESSKHTKSLKQSLNEGYIIINLLTQDNWQTLPQWSQVNINSRAGMALLNQNLCQLLRFVDAVKNEQQWKNLPIIYFGGSFGGFYGGLINLLLSNREFLHETQYDILTPAVKKQLSNLQNVFDAFIIHDGGMDYLNQLGIQWENPITIPTLLLHNFDDLRVGIHSTLTFIKEQFDSNVARDILHYHMTPQGAEGIFQPLTQGFYCNTERPVEGHFIPSTNKYQKEYYKAISIFLHQLPQPQRETNNINERLVSMRYQHSKKLVKNKPYRLYNALLRYDGQDRNCNFFSNMMSISPMIHRLGRCFSILAYQHPCQDKQLSFKHILLVNMPLMINLIQRRKDLFGCLSVPENNTTRQTIRSGNQKVIAASSSSSSVEKTPFIHFPFVLTSDAIQFLKNEDSPITLLQRSRQYSKIIDITVLRFFKEKETLNTMNDFSTLWNLDNLSLTDITLPLGSASRAFSVIKSCFPKNKSLALKLLIKFQGCDPLYFFTKFGHNELNYETLCIIATTIMQQPEQYRKTFINQLQSIYGKSPDKIQLLKWLNKIPIDKREILVKRYLTAATAIIGSKSKCLFRLPHVLLNENIIHSATALEQLENSIATITPC